MHIYINYISKMLGFYKDVLSIIHTYSQFYLKVKNWNVSFFFHRANVLVIKLARTGLVEESRNGAAEWGVGVPSLHDAVTAAVPSTHDSSVCGTSAVWNWWETLNISQIYKSETYFIYLCNILLCMNWPGKITFKQ